MKINKPNTPSSVSITNISKIPTEATPDDGYRLAVQILGIDERQTRNGRPCYFLQCQDEQGGTFSGVLWQNQFNEIRELGEEITHLTLVVRPPKEGFSSFTLFAIDP